MTLVNNKLLQLEQVRVVLVNTTHPGNIGAAARAIKNMGLSQLVLVAPKNYPDDKALWRAANATDILANAVIVNSLEQAIEGCGLVVGSSARDRSMPWPLLDPKQCAAKVSEEMQQHPVALVFGREDRGLKNEELQLCHYHMHIPANPDYSSLNLSAAVQVICYEIRMVSLMTDGSGQTLTDEQTAWDVEYALTDDVERFYQHLEKVVIDLGVLNPKTPRQLMNRLRRLYGRVRLDKMEVNLLRGILTQIEYKLGTRESNNKSDNNDFLA